MNPWLVLLGVMAATAVVTAAFWFVLMPRLAARSLGKVSAMALVAGFAALLIGIPTAALVLAPRRDTVWICALIVGWAAAVRGAGWVIARKYFVPRLRAGADAPKPETLAPGAPPPEKTPDAADVQGPASDPRS